MQIVWTREKQQWDPYREDTHASRLPLHIKACTSIPLVPKLILHLLSYSSHQSCRTKMEGGSDTDGHHGKELPLNLCCIFSVKVAHSRRHQKIECCNKHNRQCNAIECSVFKRELHEVTLVCQCHQCTCCHDE